MPAAAGRRKPSPLRATKGIIVEVLINRRLRSLCQGLVRGKKQGFEGTNIDNWKKGGDEVLGSRHRLHLSFSTIFSKHLMIPNLIVVLNTTMF